MNDARPALGVVRLEDCDDLARRHPVASALLTPETVSVYARFPGAHPRFPLLYYLHDGAQACSYCRCIPDQVTVDGVSAPWAWTGDNFTQPAFRGRGLSTELQRLATSDLHAHGIGRGSVFSTDATLHIFGKLGFVLVGHAPRFLLLRSAAPLLSAHVPGPAFRRALGFVARPVMAVAGASLKAWNRLGRRTTMCRPASTCPESDLPRLLSQLSADHRVHFELSADMLSRKIDLAERAGRFSTYLIYDRVSEMCLAYMVVRRRFQDRPLAGRYRGFELMTLMDFGCAPGHAVAAEAIVTHLVDQFFASDCQVLELVSNRLDVNRAAARRGLMAVGRGMSFNWSVPAQWNWDPRLRRLESWPLTNFCGDAFSY